MQDTCLTREKILGAAGEVLRRHGPTKATVVDVAQALGVSHGSIYRFFPTKAALREAVVAQWLNSIADTMEAFSVPDGTEGLRAWLEELHRVKCGQKDRTPELFEAFRVLSAEEPGAVRAYKERLEVRLASLIERGTASGTLGPLAPRPTARALLTATVRFHHPGFAKDWDQSRSAADFEELWTLVVPSLGSPRSST